MKSKFSPHKGAAIAGVLVVLGVGSIWGTVLQLYALWTTDPLKSIGMVIPFVSFLLILRAWRSLRWELDGTWWGLVLLVGLGLLVKLREQSILILVLAPQWTLNLPPASAVALLYGIGAVLLFGGVRLLKKALFPVALLVFVDPIPHVFNVYVDLPLQRASAHVARGFAMALGQPLSPDKLRLMFTPEFGMFIAPGCNGIRGAVTMGLIALVAGYLYRFRMRAHVAVVLGAIALGYVFNFVRLCVLVLFYLVALHFPALQDRAENADYLIGAVLFFVAVYLLYTVIHRLGSRNGVEGLMLPVETAGSDSVPLSLVPRSFVPRVSAFALLTLLGLAGTAQTMRGNTLPTQIAAEDKTQGNFAERVGTYTRVRTWNENLTAGTLLYHFAEYAPDGGGDHISVGISPVLGAHDTMVCHSARGEDPLWHGAGEFATAGGVEVPFNVSYFNDGAVAYVEATTLCGQGTCGEYGSKQQHFGLVYSKPSAGALLNLAADRPIPILMKVESIDTTQRVETARVQLSAELQTFLHGVDVDGLTKSYRKE